MKTVKLNSVAAIMFAVGSLVLAVPMISNAGPIQHSLAGAAFNPQLRHFFPGDRLSAGGGMVDLVSGKTLTPANPVLSVAQPDHLSVAPKPSGPLTLSGPWDIVTTKPFLIMGVFSTLPDKGLGGFEANPVYGVSSGFEIFINQRFSSSNLLNYDSKAIDLYNDGAGYTNVAAGLLVIPGVTVTFFYAADNGYWEQNTQSIAGWLTLLPISTQLAAISSTTSGIRKINGLLVYQFDAAPTGLKAAVTTMRESFIQGRNLPYPGW